MTENLLLISIAGGSGAGKTTVAEIIENDFEEDVLLISTDRFYKNFEDPEKANYDHPNSIDWELMQEKLGELLESGETEIPQYDFTTHSRDGFEKVSSRDIIILEGIFALIDEKVNDLSSLRIFVDTDDDIRFIRRLERDIEERGRTKESVIEQWRSQVKPMHEEFIESSKRNAHVIIPEDPDGQMRATATELIESRIHRFLTDKSS